MPNNKKLTALEEERAEETEGGNSRSDSEANCCWRCWCGLVWIGAVAAVLKLKAFQQIIAHLVVVRHKRSPSAAIVSLELLLTGSTGSRKSDWSAFHTQLTHPVILRSLSYWFCRGLETRLSHTVLHSLMILIYRTAKSVFVLFQCVFFFIIS